MTRRAWSVSLAAAWVAAAVVLLVGGEAHGWPSSGAVGGAALVATVEPRNAGASLAPEVVAEAPVVALEVLPAEEPVPTAPATAGTAEEPRVAPVAEVTAGPKPGISADGAPAGARTSNGR